MIENVIPRVRPAVERIDTLNSMMRNVRMLMLIMFKRLGGGMAGWERKVVFIDLL